MRNYTNTLLFESALDSIPSTGGLVYSTAFNLFNPRVSVVEEDCDTTLGVPVALDAKWIGSTELETGLRISSSRLITLASSGATQVDIRTLYSCVSKGGVCQACLAAGRPRLAGSSIGSVVQIRPELLVDSADLTLPAGSTSLTLPHSPAEYDVLYVYLDGMLLAPSAYTLVGNAITFPTPSGVSQVFGFKFYVISNAAYYNWLANTYSGSLLGIKSLLDLPLPVKASLMRTCVNEIDIESIRELLIQSDFAEEDFVQYVPSIKDPLEKAIFVLTLGSIFLS